jgi:hypothetical protein
VMYIKVAIHQPNHWPYLGFFHKIIGADLFILFDTAQFSDGDYHHRNRIRNPNSEGYIWLTVPIVKERRPIREIRIKNDSKIKNVVWREYHRAIIDRIYQFAPKYDKHQEFLDRLYSQEWTNLIDMNRSIIDYLLDVLCIRTPVITSSALSCEHDGGVYREDAYPDPILSDHTSMRRISQHATWRIISMCQEVGADTYISGPLGRDYMDIQLFERYGITVEFQKFLHPVYPQTFSPFIKNLSALDYILNVESTDFCQQDPVAQSAVSSRMINREV